MKQVLIATLILSASTSVFAIGTDNLIPLKDGSTVHIYADRKMAMENQYGRATMMSEGAVMETKDGKEIVMHGNEVFRLDAELHQD